MSFAKDVAPNQATARERRDGVLVPIEGHPCGVGEPDR